VNTGSNAVIYFQGCCLNGGRKGLENTGRKDRKKSHSKGRIAIVL
jgi:hypothetical protein